MWADDNAKVLEFLTLPALRGHDQGVKWRRSSASSGRSARGRSSSGRTGHPRLEKTWQEGGCARFVHTFLHAQCDLPRGIVSVGMRFHDGRTACSLILTGNYACNSTFAGERFGLDAEDAVTTWDIDLRSPLLTLVHRSECASPISAGRCRLAS